MSSRELLDEKIAKSGLKRKYLAEQLNLTRAGFYNKLAGKSEFTGSEIGKLCRLLRISIEEADTIFFATM